MFKAILSAAILAFSVAQAQNSTTGQLTREASSNTVPTGLVPYLGVNAGYTDQQNSNIQSEGMPSSIKVLGSYYLSETPAVFDLGYGLQNQQFSRAAAQDKAINAGALELAARYKFANQWQAGVVMNQFFDKGAHWGANQADAQFAGLQALKEFGLEKGYVARAGARFMTDLNVDRKTVNMMMVDFQLGWDAKARQTPAVKVAEAPVAVYNKDDKALVIEDSVSNFDINSANLGQRQEDYLRKLSKALAENKGLVEEMQVIGHADKTGTDAINKPLSEKRAESVAGVLKTNNTGAKMQVWGMGSESPISEILEKNRRTEIKFIGVKDEEKLQEVLKSIE